MRLLYLDWPHLPLRLALGRDPGADETVVLGGRPWDPGPVLDRSPAAGALGVRRGQPLGTAHSLVPEALFLPLDPAGLADPFEAALDALNALAPAVEGEVDPADPRFGRVFIGIEGLGRLWGDEPALVERALAIVEPLLPGPPRVGIGNTRFGAGVAARIGSGVDAIPAGGRREEAAFLAPLPLTLLPAEPGVHERLRVLGLETMGQLAALDHSAVVARFGPAGAEMHDLVRGMDRRPLRPRRPLERLGADVELEPPAGELEALRFVLHHLCTTLCEQLAARGAGAARAALTLSLERPQHDPGSRAMAYEQALPEPSSAAELLERLLMARIEADPPSAPVERLALQLDGTAPEAGQQLTLFDRQGAHAARLEWQLASLAIRFGEDRILRATTADTDDPIAERRFDWHGAVGADA